MKEAFFGRPAESEQGPEKHQRSPENLPVPEIYESDPKFAFILAEYIDMYCKPGDAKCEKDRRDYLGIAKSLVPKLADASARAFLEARIAEVEGKELKRAA